MSRTKVLRLESLNVMLKIIDRINMKMDNLLAKGEFKFEDMKEEALNTNQRHAGLQHQAQQPRLAMKADVQRRQEDSQKYGGLRTRWEIRRYLI